MNRSLSSKILSGSQSQSGEITENPNKFSRFQAKPEYKIYILIFITSICYPIILKIYTEHASTITVLSTKFHNDWATEN